MQLLLVLQERSERLELAKLQALQHSRRSRVNSLFEVWDNDHSGYLELEEMQLVLSNWRGFNTQQAQEHGTAQHTYVHGCCYTVVVVYSLVVTL